MQLDRQTRWTLLLGFMVLSLASLRSLPVMPFGADFRNIAAYHQCARDVSPYLISGPDCGDPWGRGFLYPPLLFEVFRWTRWFALEKAIAIWASFQFGLLALLFGFWVKLEHPRREGRLEIAIFTGLLLFEYPLIFLIERGGSDVWALLLAMAGAVLLQRERALAAGVAFGVAAAYKLYPGVAGAVLALGLFFAAPSKRPRRDAPWLRFTGGVGLGLLGVSLVLFRETRVFVTRVMPALSQSSTPPCEYNHSLVGAAGDYPNLGRLLFLGLAAVWVYAAARALSRRDYLAAVAGAFAISTYLQGTSWDYNLVTVYPLLLLCFLRGRAAGRWGVLWVGLIGFVGERAFYVTSAHPDSWVLVHLAIQIWFLVSAALEVAHSEPTQVAAAA
ncbi:MAG: glycosyltransferase 87 family protein [Polyangiaceae bacterium]